MGPWGKLRFKEIDGETVGAEIGMTVQLFNTSHSCHFHHPQEICIPLTATFTTGSREQTAGAGTPRPARRLRTSAVRTRARRRYFSAASAAA